MIEVAEGYIRTQGRSYCKGETLELGTEEEKRLVDLKVAKYVMEDDPVPVKKSSTGHRAPRKVKPESDDGPQTDLPVK